MYGEPNQQYYSSPKKAWETATSAKRNQMLIDAGYATHRTLTLRNYHDLPAEVIVDLITAHNYPGCQTDKGHKARTSPRPVKCSLPDSQSLSGVGGFTLLELLVVILILGSLAGAAHQALDDAPAFAEANQHLFAPSVVSPPYGLGALPAEPQQQGEQLFQGQQK